MEMLGEKEHLAFKAAELDRAQTEHARAHRVAVVTTAEQPKFVTPTLVRQFMTGMSQTALDALPSLLKGQLETIVRRMQRQQTRVAMRGGVAWEHRQSSLSGGGKREVARRLRQIAAGQLREANGLVR